MTSPSETVHAFLAHMERLDYDAAMQLVSDDCEYTNVPLATVHGPAAIRAVLEPFFAHLPENVFGVVREASAGPIVFVERLDRHLVGGRWAELPVTGVFEVRDGRITVWRDYFDAATLMAFLPTA